MAGQQRPRDIAGIHRDFTRAHGGSQRQQVFQDQAGNALAGSMRGGKQQVDMAGHADAAKAGDLAGVAGDAQCDLADPAATAAALQQLLTKIDKLDLVILNAGMLGQISPIQEVPLATLQATMDINLWANKTVLDWLLAWGRPIRQIVAISSGAAVLGNRGWSGYALSKAALNMLIRLYAHEFGSTHLNAVAPGLIETAMMDALCSVEESDRFPALQRIHAARGTERMLTPRSAAERLLRALPQLLETESGSYVDIRTLLAPEEYQELLAASTAARNVS